jgi:hypothetical protein
MGHVPAQAPISVGQPQLDSATPVAGADEQAEQARNSQRMKAMKGGRVVIHSSGAGFDCMVRSLSPSGAHLTFADPIDLPANFELYFPAENVRVGVSLAWRKGLDAGVRFEKPLDWLSKHVAAKR